MVRHKTICDIGQHMCLDSYHDVALPFEYGNDIAGCTYIKPTCKTADHFKVLKATLYTMRNKENGILNQVSVDRGSPAPKMDNSDKSTDN